MRALLSLIVIGFLSPVAASAMPLPDCAGTVEVAHAHVVRVEKNGALILNDGRAMLLEGIRLPGADRPADPIASAALDALRELAMKEPLTLTSTRPKEDRYDRVRVQAFGNSWLQVELLRRGLARAYIAPDREECSPDFYEAEVEARNARRGLWALPEYGVLQAGSFSAPPGSFQVVEGRIANVATHDGRVFLDFNTDFHKGLSATIAPDDRKAFRGSDPALEDLVGHEVRIRGIVEKSNARPVIALFNPKQVEFLH